MSDPFNPPTRQPGRKVIVTEAQRQRFQKLLEEGRRNRDALRKYLEPMLTLSDKARRLVLK